MIRNAELVGGVEADKLPGALEVFEIIQHARFVGIDVVIGHASHLRQRGKPNQRVVEITPLSIEDIGVGIWPEEGFDQVGETRVLMAVIGSSLA